MALSPSLNLAATPESSFDMDMARFEKMYSGTDWQEYAQCRNDDPEVCFAYENERGALRVMASLQARRMCVACPVADICLRGAIERREGYGIWGGLTAEEIRALNSDNSKQRRAEFLSKSATELAAVVQTIINKEARVAARFRY